eukprot:g23962.t1
MPVPTELPSPTSPAEDEAKTMTAEALTATALTAEPMATQTASQTALTAATASQTPRTLPTALPTQARMGQSKSSIAVVNWID